MVRYLVHIVAAIFVIASVIAKNPVNADKKRDSPLVRYIIERSYDNGDTWTHRGNVELRTINSNTPRLVFIAASSSDDDLLRDVSRDQVLFADRLLYRLRDATDAHHQIMRLSLTPCSIIRGFEAKTSKNIVLKEQFNIIVDTPGDTKVFVAIGLQHAPVTNLHHSTASTGYNYRGDSCDTKSVNLFENVTVQTIVKAVRLVNPRRVPNFEEGLFAEAKKIKKEKKEENDNLPEVDDRTFFEKYWHYILMFIVWTALQSLFKPPEPKKNEEKSKKD